MEPYAVVQTGGKQYLVQKDDTVTVERIDAEPGSTIELTVLAASDGTALNVGKPELAGAKVTSTIVEHKRGPKLVSFKKKRRKGYSRKMGHRQEQTILKIDSLA